jgi:hypothetical protein
VKIWSELPRHANRSSSNSREMGWGLFIRSCECSVPGGEEMVDNIFSTGSVPAPRAHIWMGSLGSPRIHTSITPTTSKRPWNNPRLADGGIRYNCRVTASRLSKIDRG